jgi:hypothetical protein
MIKRFPALTFASLRQRYTSISFITEFLRSRMPRDLQNDGASIPARPRQSGLPLALLIAGPRVCFNTSPESHSWVDLSRRCHGRIAP